MVGNLLVLESNICCVKVEVRGEVNDNVYVNGNINKTKKRNNTDMSLTMAVLSRRAMNNLLVKAVKMSLMGPNEVKGDLEEAVESWIDLLWYLVPPHVTNTIEEGFYNNNTNILGVVHILRVI